MDRAEKREFVSWLNGAFKESGSVVVAHYTGLTVAQMSDLRSKMRDAGGSVKVAKTALPRSLFRARNRKAFLICLQVRRLLLTQTTRLLLRK